MSKVITKRKVAEKPRTVQAKRTRTEPSVSATTRVYTQGSANLAFDRPSTQPEAKNSKNKQHQILGPSLNIS